MTRMPRLLPALAVLPLLAACAEVPTTAVVQPAPVFPAPTTQAAPAPAPRPAPTPLQAPAQVTTAPLSSGASPSNSSSTSSAAAAPAPTAGAITASNPRELGTPPEQVTSALLPGTPPSAVFQNGDGCYLFSIERTEPLSGYPVRDENGVPICENDDGSVGPRPSS